MSAAIATATPFAPRRRLRVDWGLVAAASGAVAGLALAAAGALALRGHPPGALAPTRGVDLLALAFLAAAGPAALVQWRRQAHRAALDARLPDLLHDLASLHKAGLTLHESLVTAARGDYGALNADARWAADQVRWNVPILTVLENLMRRLGTPLARRTLTVVIEAGHSGGNVPEVLEIAAGNARASIALRDERKRGMGTYTIITYVASLVFIGVAVALQGVFVPKMIDAFAKTAGTSGSALGFSPLPTHDQFRDLFYAAALVQAIGNGFVGGIMSDGRVGAGLRHAASMVALCFLGFLLAP